MNADFENQIGLSVENVAALTTLSAKSIRRAIARGELPSFRAGSRIILRREDVTDWLFSQPNEPMQTAPNSPQMHDARNPYSQKQTQPMRGSLHP